MCLNMAKYFQIAPQTLLTGKFFADLPGKRGKEKMEKGEWRRKEGKL